ncbi:MAG: hypothetical protein ACQEXJ_05600 [Myxococcota bacterium]
MRKWIALGIAAALFVGGCARTDETEAADEAEQVEQGQEATEPAAEEAKPGEEAKAEEAKAEEAHPVWPDVDLEAELERLQGTWHVRATFGAKEDSTWKIEGDKLEITDPEGETTLAKIVMLQPGEIGVKTGGSTTYHAYARSGDDVWIGLGTGGAKTDDAFYVGEDRGVVVFDGESCRYYKEKMGFGGGDRAFEEPVDVECEVQEGGDKAVLHYQTPVFMKDDQFEDHQVMVVGDALLNEQLRKEHRARRPE